MNSWMVLFIVAFVAVVNVSAGVDFKMLRKIYHECLKKDNMTHEQVVQLVKAGKWKKVMCIQACFMESLSIIRSDGTLDLEEMEFFLSKTIDALIDICVDCALTVTGDRCSIIQSFQDCVTANTIGETVL
nr:odorant binding protein 11 [Trissolcus basalis]